MKFLLKMRVGFRSSKKVVLLPLLLIFRRKCVKMGAQMEGGRSHIFDVFSIFFSLVPLWVPLGLISLTLGLPGHHFGTFLSALGIILAPLGLTKMIPRQLPLKLNGSSHSALMASQPSSKVTPKASKMEPWPVILMTFRFWAPPPVSMKMNPQNCALAHWITTQ